MDALRASYANSCSDSESDSDTPRPRNENHQASGPLPPPPLALLSPPNSIGELNYSQTAQSGRVRSFPHVEGNYALHVFIPVYIPSSPKKELVQYLKKVMSLVPGLHVVDVDIPLNILCKDDNKLEQVALGREFHISLGRTVPIRVHQIDSIVTMLRQKLQFQRRYWIDFNKWEVFVNDDQTRSFLSVEVIAGGLAEITRQIQAVNEVYRLHNLPEFYEDPRPHISLVWALGNISDSLKRAVEEMRRHINVGGSAQKRIFTCKFNGIECKIANPLASAKSSDSPRIASLIAVLGLHLMTLQLLSMDGEQLGSLATISLKGISCMMCTMMDTDIQDAVVLKIVNGSDERGCWFSCWRVSLWLDRYSS